MTCGRGLVKRLDFLARFKDIVLKEAMFIHGASKLFIYEIEFFYALDPTTQCFQ